MDSIPSLLGLALRAGRLAVGRSPSGSPAGATRGTCCCWPATRRTTPSAGPFISAKPEKPFASPSPDQQELGSGLGRASCAMLALTDVGFAAAVAEKLAQLDPEAYGPAWETLSNKAARVKKRRAEKRSPHKNKGARRAGKRKPDGPSNDGSQGNG